MSINKDNSQSTREPQIQRRGNQRFRLRTHATLISGDGNWSAHLVNFSVDGALIAITRVHHLQVGDEVSLTIELNESAHLDMLGRVVHMKDHFIGLECRPGSIEDHALLEDLVDKFKEGTDTHTDY